MTHDSKELPPLEVRVQEARYAMFRLLRAGAPHSLLTEQWSKLEMLLDTPAPQPGMRAEGEALEYALGALRTIAASAHDTTAKQLAAIAKAGIDLAEKGGSKPAPDALREAQLQQSARVLRDALVQQSRIVRNFSNPDDVFEAVPTRFITEECETTSAPPVPPPDGAAEALRVIGTMAICEDGETAEQRALIVDACREVALNALASQPPVWEQPPSDDVRSALADDLDLIGGALSKYRHPSVVTHAFYRVSAALRSAPVSAPATDEWKCFHCGDVFTDPAAAKEHFGPDTEWQAGCIDPLTKDEKERRQDQVDMYTELDREREENSRLMSRDYVLSCYERDLAKFFNGAKSVHQASLVLDSMEGRALAAEEKLAALSTPAVGVTREAIAWQSISGAPESIKLFAKGCETDPGRNSIIECGGTIDDGRPFLLLRKDALEKSFDRWLVLPAVSSDSPVPDATVSEPVAWQKRPKFGNARVWTSFNIPNPPPEDLEFWRDQDYEIRCLYASPQHVGREAAVSDEAMWSIPDTAPEPCSCCGGKMHLNAANFSCDQQTSETFHTDDLPGAILTAVSARDAVIEAINGYVHDQAADPPFTLEKYRAGILKAAIRSLTGAKP